MKILVTNDDGIHGPGLWAAVEAVKHVGQVFVVAPDREQSGVGTSLTLHAPVRVGEASPEVEGSDHGITVHVVEGTPGDCCILALEHLVGPVDLVISGVNQGSNLGEDVLISGTVGAALQGYVRGFPSIAISVAALKDTRFEVAAGFLRMMAADLANGVALPPVLVNVNVPNEPAGNIAGISVTRLGRRSFGESVKEGEDSRRKQYWIVRDRAPDQAQEEGTDVWALHQKLISVTPIHTALTATESLERMESLLQDYGAQLLGRGD